MSILLLLAAANGAAVTPAQPTSAQPEIVVTGSRVTHYVDSAFVFEHWGPPPQ